MDSRIVGAAAVAAVLARGAAQAQRRGYLRLEEGVRASDSEQRERLGANGTS